MLIGDYIKAEECFHEAVAIDPENQPRLEMLKLHYKANINIVCLHLTWEVLYVSSLMMCGVLAVMSQNYKEAEAFLERATNFDSHSVVAWTLLGKVSINIPALC